MDIVVLYSELTLANLGEKNIKPMHGLLFFIYFENAHVYTCYFKSTYYVCLQGWRSK